MAATDPTISERRCILGLVAAFALTSAVLVPADDGSKYDPAGEAVKTFAAMNVRPGDSPQFGRSHHRNNEMSHSAALGQPLFFPNRPIHRRRRLELTSPNG